MKNIQNQGATFWLNCQYGVNLSAFCRNRLEGFSNMTASPIDSDGEA